MKSTLEQEDIQAIAGAVADILKPLILSGNGKANEPDTILDVPELAKYLTVSNKWIYERVQFKWIYERVQFKEIPYMKVKGLLRFRKAHIDKWLSSYSIPAINRQRSLLKAVK